MYYIDQNGTYPLHEYNIREAHPQTSFPHVLLPEHVAPFGYMPVMPSQYPALAPDQTVVEAPPAQIDGVWTQQWSIVQKPREQLKLQRAAAVDAIRVTTSAGNTFDGDETSQERMARAILVLQATSTPSIVWVLADNSVIQATPAELVEALALAGAAQAAIWVIN